MRRHRRRVHLQERPLGDRAQSLEIAQQQRRAGLGDYVQACDRATGTTVVGSLLERYQAGAAMELPEYWKSLGVGLVDGRVVFDDAAPLSRWRRMIVTGPDGSALKPVRLPWPS